MSEKHEIRCDGCGADLTYTGNSIDYRLVLRSEGIPSRGGAVTDMMIPPPIDAPVHFCFVGCLGIWVNRARATA